MFTLPKEVVQSIGDFKDALKDFREGRMSSDRFKGVRVPWGIYSQRGGEIFMARVRIPAGCVTPKQLEALAEFLLGASGVSTIDFRRQEDPIAHGSQRRAEAHFGLLVIGGRVEITDASFQRGFDEGPRLRLANTVADVGAAQAEDGHGFFRSAEDASGNAMGAPGLRGYR